MTSSVRCCCQQDRVECGHAWQVGLLFPLRPGQQCELRLLRRSAAVQGFCRAYDATIDLGTMGRTQSRSTQVTLSSRHRVEDVTGHQQAVVFAGLSYTVSDNKYNIRKFLFQGLHRFDCAKEMDVRGLFLFRRSHS